MEQKKELDLYRLRIKKNAKLSYYFDKITSLFIKSKKHKIKKPKKILFVRNDHIGDMVYSTQVFREVKKKFPQAKITVIATSSNKQIIEKDINVDSIIEIDLFWRRGFKGFLDYLKVLKHIRKEKFDIGIDLRRSKLNIFFFLYVPGIKTRISYYNITGGKAFLTHPVLYDKKRNYVEENIKMINKAFNFNIKNYMPEIMTDEQDKKDVDKLLKKLKLKRYVVFAPGATSDSKRWPKFDKLIEKFHEKYPKHKIVLAGGGSKDKKLINRLSKGRDYCVPLINFNLRKVSLVHKKSEVVVANDGAATDISWVSDANLVSLVNGVDLELHRPLKKSKIIHHKLPCYPCEWSKPCKRPCEKWCMDLITVEEVMKAIDDFMGKKRKAGKRKRRKK